MEKSARTINGRTMFFVAALACAAACSGGGGSDGGASDSGGGLTLSGRILDGTSPAGGAVVTVAGPNETATADSNGNFAVATSESGPAIGLTIAAPSFTDSFVVENIPAQTQDIELVLAYRRGVKSKEREDDDDEVENDFDDDDEVENDFDDDDEVENDFDDEQASSAQSSSGNPDRSSGGSSQTAAQEGGWLDCERIVFRDGSGEVIETRPAQAETSSSSAPPSAASSSSVSSVASQPAATPKPTPAPTAAPSGPFDANGNTSSFGIPGGLTGNINDGSRVWSGKCAGCHGSEKSNKSYSAIKSALSTIGEMRGVKLTNQQIADVTAYLNRRR